MTSVIEYTSTEGITWRDDQLPIDVCDDGKLIIRPHNMKYGRPYFFEWQETNMIAIKDSSDRVSIFYVTSARDGGEEDT